MANYNLKRIERDIEKHLPVIIQRETTDELLKTIKNYYKSTIIHHFVKLNFNYIFAL